MINDETRLYDLNYQISFNLKNNYFSVYGANPCVPRDYSNGGTVCVCNATYCDTVEEVKPLSSGQYLLYISSKQGLRFNKSSGTFTTKITSNSLNKGECKGLFEMHFYFHKFKFC